MKNIFNFNRKDSVCDLFEIYLQKRAREAFWAPSTGKNTRTLLLHLRHFNGALRLSQLSKEVLTEFLEYLRVSVGMEDSSARKQFRLLTSFLHWVHLAGYVLPPDVASFKPVFKLPHKPVIFLSREELLRLYRFRIPQAGSTVQLTDMDGHIYFKTVKHPRNLERARDLFCFLALTGLRYSDMAALHRSDIVDGVLTVVTQKTNARLQIKLNSYALAILAKYPTLPVICNQRLNIYLKEVCELCGFNTPVHITLFREGRRYDVTVPKWSRITSHCGRRTFICLMLSIGVPPQVVMKFTGHSDYASMKPYIDISERAQTDAIATMEAELQRCPAP